MKQERLKSLFSYSNGQLYYNHKPNFTSIQTGDAVGGYDKGSGYMKVRVDGVQTYHHRVIWIMNEGGIPKGLVVDHINRDKSDNSLDNLRLVSHQFNLLNNSGSGVHRYRGLWRVKFQLNR